MEEKLDKLRLLYEQVHSCTSCFHAPSCKIKADSKRIVRIAEKQSLESEVFLIAQALGEHTQRLSGLPYTKENGVLSLSGLNLDTFLHLFGYTIDSSDTSGRYKYAYSSDVVQCYPGKRESGKGDRKPSTSEVINCINQGFLLREISLVEPKLIILMGKASRDSFYKQLLHAEYPASLTDHMNEVVVGKDELPTYQVIGMNLAILPIQHPSGANPRFNSMKDDFRLAELIRRVIK